MRVGRGGIVVFGSLGIILSYSHERGDCARSVRGDGVRHGDRVMYASIGSRIDSISYSIGQSSHAIDTAAVYSGTWVTLLALLVCDGDYCTRFRVAVWVSAFFVNGW